MAHVTAVVTAGTTAVPQGRGDRCRPPAILSNPSLAILGEGTGAAVYNDRPRFAVSALFSA
jgi:hypothetical protein